jgi:hypothetical protein
MILAWGVYALLWLFGSFLGSQFSDFISEFILIMILFMKEWIIAETPNWKAGIIEIMKIYWNYGENPISKNVWTVTGILEDTEQIL